jgi:hypothetical protein
MTKSLQISIAGSILIISLTSARVLQDNGIAGYTNSPSEQNCTACHSSFALNSGGGSIAISTTPSMSPTGYTPGATYTVAVTVAKTGVNLFGIGAEILTSTNTNAGTISIINASETKLLNSGARRNVVHQLNGGTGADSKTFSFQWVAPATPGAATIYAAGVAANGNGQNSSDYVYTTSLSISSSVGIKEYNLSSTVSLYPNPARESVTLSYELDKDALVECSLSGLNGQHIADFYSEKQTAGNHEQKLLIPSSVQTGLYLLHLKVDGQATSRRLIIN